jgi:hypothetical protein
MADLDWIERFTGAYATPELVGREDLRAQIESVLRDPAPEPRMVFLVGPGGIGKTRLLNVALQTAHAIPGLRAASGVIDLYHVPTHTSSGLADALYGALTPPSGPFRRYEQERRALERMRLSGEVTGVAEQRERTLDVFASDFKALAARQRIVLALDTAERLVYGLGHMAAPIAQIAESWNWLVESLPEWRNVVLLIAGRAEAGPLYIGLPDTLAGGVISIRPAPFTEAESLAYFEAVAKATRAEDNEEISTRVHGLTGDMRRLAHLYAGGRPILLALLVDALSVGGIERLPRVLQLSARAAADMSEDQLNEVQASLEEQLIARLREVSRLGDTILALGRVPKGADKELLARLLGISSSEADARLAQVRRLSFVKIRPSDEQVFLHDEMYALLRRQVYDKPNDAPEAEKAAAAILSYYQAQLERCRRDMDTLYAPVEVEGKDRLDLGRLGELHIRRQTLLAEVVYYRLRQDAVRGFQRFYRYTREAALSGDTALDVQLQAEMLSFLAEREAKEYQETIDGLDRNLALWVLALRPVVRAFSGQQYKLVLEEAERVRRAGAKILKAGMPTSEAILSTWEAYALTYLGDPQSLGRAREKLDTAITSMEQLLAPAEGTSAASEVKLWRARAVLAFAYRVRAYLQRVRGFMQGAAEDFRRAAALWRQVNLQVELAQTLNDLGFAMAELGHWADARTLVEDALELRRQLGPRSPVGLSLNTLALIDLREGAYTTAIQRSESALALFRVLENRRGIGLALIGLAEAQRRYSGTSLVPTAEERVALLREARDHAGEALIIFEQLDERLRCVEALIEQGCACRDWAEVRYTNPSPRDNLDRLVAEGEAALRQAAELAGEEILYRRVDALVNLAWLGFFSGRQDLLESAAAEAEDAIPAAYHINKQTGLPDVPLEQAQVLLWPQLGKLHTLYGHRAFDRYIGGERSAGVKQREEDLLEAADYYLWSLQYSVLYSEDYRDMRRTKDEIYRRLKELNFEQLRAVADRMRLVEAQNHLGESEMQRFLRHRALLYGR